MAAAWALVIGAAALTGPWRRDPLGPFGVICLLTLVVLATDVMTGSRLQLQTPFGLSLLEAGRFYGIGNEALGIYGVTALFAAGWLALLALRRYPSSRRPALLAVAVIGVFAVFASGWPGFGGKVGGTIAMVPCFLLLAAAVAGIRLSWRLVLLVAVSGLALFAVFALISYFTPATGPSDIGSFAGGTVHGHSGALLLRKINSNLGSLSVSAVSPLMPIVVVVTGLMLWRPAWFRLKTIPLAYAALPLLRPFWGCCGWCRCSAGSPTTPGSSCRPLRRRWRCRSASRSPRLPPTRIGGTLSWYCRRRIPRLTNRWPARVKQKVTCAIPAIANCRRAVPAHHLAPEGDRRRARTRPGGAILAANHQSVVDSVFLPLMLDRPVTFSAKAEYFTASGPAARLWAAYLKATNQLQMDRDGPRAAQDTLDAALVLLRAGNLFGIYPEGTRSPDGRLYRGRPGVGYLALKSGLPVIPVAILGTRRVLPPGRVVPRPGRIEVRIGAPLQFPPELTAGPPGKARRLIAEQVISAIQKLSGQEYVHMFASDRKAELTAASQG